MGRDVQVTNDQEIAGIFSSIVVPGSVGFWKGRPAFC